MSHYLRDARVTAKPPLRTVGRCRWGARGSLARAALLAAGALAASCGGGGGSSTGPNSYDAAATLQSVRFLDPNDVNSESESAPPQTAPLVQSIEFTFSGSPDPNRVNSTVLPILDDQNLPVPGRYTVDGPVVTFIPELPTRPVSTTASGQIDNGGAGLRFNTAYTLRVGPNAFAFVRNVDAALRSAYPDPNDSGGILMKFRTKSSPDADAFRGVAATAPTLVSADPLDGSTGVSPNLFTDPDQLFAARPTFRLVFDVPLDPSTTNLNDTVFQLIDLDDQPSGFPNGLPLGIDVALVSNRADESIVEITPAGILPFGHLLALQYDSELKGLAETGTPAGGPVVATTFTVASAPSGTVADSIVETFDDDARQEQDIDQIGSGNLPADWNRDGSSVLQAALEFNGTGELGRFLPAQPANGETTVIVLDTASQAFPLLDGSTPDAKPNTVVLGGVFHFTDIDIPDGVSLQPSGSNPLVITATGSVRIAGEIVIRGDNGSSDYAYDSAITSIPGGAAVAGGGRGGDSHPVAFFPADTINYLTLVTPQFAETGFGIDPVDGTMKRIGGTGAQSGILDEPASGLYSTNQEWGTCDEFHDGNSDCKIAGGGGGSHYRAGVPPKSTSGNVLNGIANVLPDGTGKWIIRTDETCLAGAAGAHPFSNDGTTTNDFYGKLGQLTRLIGGQGGGGGGTLADSYYCGNWCEIDADPANNGCCGPFDPFVSNGTRAASVGDSRGGGGGGGGGAFLLQALGDITLESTALIDAVGGAGGGGEGIGCSYWGGGGGGGAGGMVILQSASTILVRQFAVIDVRRGSGDDASPDNDYLDCGTSGSGAIGDGGDGGHGMIQLQVPAGTTATVVQPGTTDTNGSLRPPGSWVDPTNTLAPVEFTPISIALSTWHDFGRVIARAPSNTNPVFSFSGLDANGFVATDVDGNVLSPDTADIVCGYLGQIDPGSKLYLDGEEPRADFIPTNATIKVEFQGADAIVEGSKEVDPASLTAWSSLVSVANGKQFIRWRITFDTTADSSTLSTSTRLPMVERLEIHAEF
ncbi:MAG: hypothetical protein JNL90_07730 [Planctomycetes bacterium]|nr:hypothetical protein [Planctomycetota bacterium]